MSKRALTLDSARGLPLKVEQRLRGGELITTIRTLAATGVELSTGYRGALDEAGLAMLLRVMARKVERASVDHAVYEGVRIDREVWE